MRKDSIIVPVQKRKGPKSLNDYRPVALASLVMKTFENIEREAFKKEIQAELDTLQFAYRSCRGDAFNTLLNMTVTHLEGAVFSATTFFFFSLSLFCF